jgi:hypothetical protein
VSQEFTEDERVQLAQLVMNIFGDWEIAPELQLMLLGLPEKTRQRELTRFKHGTPLPDDEELLDRARHIIGINSSLHLLYPLNRNMASFWLRTRNRMLRGTPLHIMADNGLAGMNRIWRHLDCTQNWDD